TLDVEWHGMAFRPVAGPELDASGPAQDLLHLRKARVALRAKVHCNAVTRPHRDSHGGSRDVEVRQLQDLADLRMDLPLLARPAVLAEQVDLGPHAAGDPPGEGRPGCLLA